MRSRESIRRFGLALLLVMTVLGVSTAVGGVAGPASPAGSPAEDVDHGDQANEDCPLCIEPPTAPCDATCVDTPIPE